LSDVRIAVHVGLFFHRIGHHLVVDHRIAVDAERAVLLHHLDLFQKGLGPGGFNLDGIAGFSTSMISPVTMPEILRLSIIPVQGTPMM
jgi:hypothetical protein